MAWTIYIAERPTDLGPIDNAVFGRDVSHTFLRFKDDDGKTVLELHGLAANRKTGAITNFPGTLDGYFSSLAYFAGAKTHFGPHLKVFPVTEPRLMSALSGHAQPHEFLLKSGTAQEIASCLEAGLRAAEAINAAKIPYYLFRRNGAGQNCNSVMAELVERIADVCPVPGNLQGSTPGIRHDLETVAPALSAIRPSVEASPKNLLDSIRHRLDRATLNVRAGFYDTLSQAMDIANDARRGVARTASSRAALYAS